MVTETDFSSPSGTCNTAGEIDNVETFRQEILIIAQEEQGDEIGI